MEPLKRKKPKDLLPTRPQVARLLRVHESTVTRMMKRGDLHPVKDARGWYRFDRKEIDTLAERLELRGPEITGKLYAEIYALFDRGVPLNEIVKSHKLEPDVVCKMFAEYRTKRIDELVPDETRVAQKRDETAREAERRAIDEDIAQTARRTRETQEKMLAAMRQKTEERRRDLLSILAPKSEKPSATSIDKDDDDDEDDLPSWLQSPSTLPGLPRTRKPRSPFPWQT